MQPTTLHQVQYAKTPIVAFDTDKKIPIGVFCSALECARLFFETEISCHSKRRSAAGLILTTAKNKGINSSNVFGKKITFRVAEQKYKDILGESERVIFEDGYENDCFVKKDKCRKINLSRDYSLDDILNVGDVVEMKYGLYAGIVAEILLKERAGKLSLGKFDFTIETPGGIHKYKSNVFEIVKTYL
jgi:hypothetical protein